LRIAILAYTFPRGMGYIGNMLPRHLARLGADVHYITMDLPHYFQNTNVTSTYAGFEGTSIVQPGSVEAYDGFTLHGLGHTQKLGQMRYVGLAQKLREIRPDVVQSLLPIGWIALDAAILKPQLGYKLFTANHTTASVFPLAKRESKFWEPERIKNLITRQIPGRLISLATEICYPATVDCADVAVRFFGVQPEKVRILPLGVDTDLFRPPAGEQDRSECRQIRERLGFGADEVVCIYTGQFTHEKNPLLLAQAIGLMMGQGKPVRGLFFGNGPQYEELSRMPGCVIHPFVPNQELPAYYRAADIGVWPTQESTSMLDATACGLPIVVNDTLQAVERIRGNGLQYKLGDVADLARVLTGLLDPAERARLGDTGARRMADEFSWKELARVRLKDYEAALASPR